MPNQGNDRSPTLTWPTADEFGRVYRTSGKLLERFEKIDSNSAVSTRRAMTANS